LAAAHDCDASTHRRHHSKQVAKHRHSAALASTSTGPAHHHSAHKATSTALDATSSGGIGWGLNGVQKNGIGLGFLPDDGSGGGTPETIFEIQNKLGQSASAQGWYAQAVSGTLFDGSQFAARKDQIIAGGVFQPAVMPTGGWWGLTSSDNQQAVAICNVMKEYTDAGQSVGTYQGTAADFKEGWATVHAACKQIAPEVKFFFTPNVASLDVYQQYYPDDPSTVDFIGIDYYPQQPGQDTFVSTMKPFHDAYTNGADLPNSSPNPCTSARLLS
ncbi:SPOSA6832_04188, partial [Sporobolomyces salmonicolor]